MANQAIQRLIAAGASPARAKAFTDMAATKSPAVAPSMPQISGPQPQSPIIKPMGPNEWYNEDYQSASSSIAPGAFKPPTADDPNFSSYYDLIYGQGSYTKTKEKALNEVAPFYSSAKRSQNLLDQGLVSYIGQGHSLADVKGFLKTTASKNPKVLGTFTIDEALSYADKLFSDYTTAIAKLGNYYTTEASKNKNFKYGLPDPKLKYGATTSFGTGTVDFRLSPTLKAAYDKNIAKYANDPNKAAIEQQLISGLIAQANKVGITPWKEEAKRRDSLKGKKLG